MFYNWFPPIGTIGLGMVSVYSDNRVPNPPAKITTFILLIIFGDGKGIINFPPFLIKFFSCLIISFFNIPR